MDPAELALLALVALAAAEAVHRLCMASVAPV
jgi:hypothetical protein